MALFVIEEVQEHLNNIYGCTAVLLSHVCSELKYDVLFVQEHWLTPDQLYKLCTISPDYICAGISAMEDALANDVLRGRPFGGVSILVRDVYKAAVCIHRSADRFVVLSIGNVVFVICTFQIIVVKQMFC